MPSINVRELIGQAIAQIGKRMLDIGNASALVSGWTPLAYPTVAGPNVSSDNATRISAVYGCVTVLSETLATLPLHWYRRSAGGGREADDAFYLNQMLRMMPNEAMTAFDLIEAMQRNLALWGNAYAYLEIDQAGRISEIYPLLSKNVRVVKENGTLVYYARYVKSGQADEERLESYQVWHIRLRSQDGLTGISPIGEARQALGLAVAAESYGARFFANDARPGVILKHPGVLKDEAFNRIKKNWEEAHKGLDNAHKVAILEEGMSIETVGIPPEDAQFLETRKFQVEEIARVYRVPPHMLADLSKATFSNIEQQSIDFVNYTMLPWIVRWEQSMMRCLLLEKERQVVFPKFNTAGLLRGDTQSRYSAYHQALMDGWANINEIRSLENLNPIENGDKHFVPLNMQTLEQAVEDTQDGQAQPKDGQGSETQPQQEQEPLIKEPDSQVDEAPKDEGRSIEKREGRVERSRARIMRTYRKLLRDAYMRIHKREAQDVLAAWEKFRTRRSENEFLLWFDGYRDGARDYAWKQLQPVVDVYSDQVMSLAADEIGVDEPDLKVFVNDYVTGMAGRHIGGLYSIAIALVKKAMSDNEDADQGLRTALDGWKSDDPGRYAHYESVRAGNATAHETYRLSGRKMGIWRKMDDNPYCATLDGKEVELDGWFADESHGVTSQGGDVYQPDSPVGHPPLMTGCECLLMAGSE